MLYPFLRNLLFSMPPEKAHYFSMNVLKKICNSDFGKEFVSRNFNYQHKSLIKNCFGLRFRNPVGLGAGFDKNALYLRELECLGFGFVEIGTVTPKPQKGNDLPRLFRLPKDKALINRMGFNNDGAQKIYERLSEWKNSKNNIADFVIGGNIGKNKLTENEFAWKDYLTAFQLLFDVVDYFTVNVSSPNTLYLRDLQNRESLQKIFYELENYNQSKPNPKPILLKIAPDLEKQQLDDIIQLSLELNLKGLVAANTTISRENLKTNRSKINKIGQGGLSGEPLKNLSNKILNYLHQHLQGRTNIISSGGVFTPDDAKKRLINGASLLQVWTGFIYEGPAIASNICTELKNQFNH